MRLAADANALLSAVLGGRARMALEHPDVAQVLTAEETFAEVQEYAAFLARKRRLPLDLILLAVATLPVTVVKQEEYARYLAEANRRIGKRDPDDVP
ncbi:MAG TPA: PIN domain-containing protein, partial [Terriglobia bacterium]|nr:PIN domain-containing protein [Terriglobia bacterium]